MTYSKWIDVIVRWEKWGLGILSGWVRMVGENESTAISETFSGVKEVRRKVCTQEDETIDNVLYMTCTYKEKQIQQNKQHIANRSERNGTK